jgi:xylose dehydrogenase (NAD/NADP)
VGIALGLLSTARINRAILRGASLTDAVEVVAVASRDEARAREYAAAHGITRAHGSYEALLADDALDAVYISLPNSLHVEWTLRALAGGKHVLCEKPLTRHPHEAEQVYDAAEAAGLVVMEAFMYRHHPQTKLLKELIAGGAIGELRVIRSAFGFTVESDVNVRMRPDLDGGSLMDVGCYCVSGSRLLAGEPEAVRAEQVLGSTGVEVRFAGVLRFPGDVLAHFDSGLDVASQSFLEVLGTEGIASVASPWLCVAPAVELRRGDARERRVRADATGISSGAGTTRIEVEDVDRFQLELENFAGAIRGDEKPLLGRDDAVGQARAIAALYRSAENRAEPTRVQ